jgi:nucleoside-diphosphate-sugar epimerase
MEIVGSDRRQWGASTGDQTVLANDRIPSIVVSGASGVVGRHFLKVALDQYRIFALARRSQSQAGIEPHPNLTWIQIDIANWESVKTVTERIMEHGGADFTLHLAAHYDFSNRDHPEYLRTNVNGTRHMLEQAKALCVRRFVFASSVAACIFPPPGGTVDEDSDLGTDFPYARSKHTGEQLVRDFSSWFPCSIVRLAAVFSDWCEYPPLYVFLKTWLSRRWNSRMLAGRGRSAVSYIHVADLNRLFLTILRDSDGLPPLTVYLGSPDGCSSHLELFATATRFYFGLPRRPVLLPKAVAAPGIVVRDLFGRLMGNRPFERLWMLRYIDRRLEIDSSRTRQALGWQPTPRYRLARRLLFLVERMKGEPHIWQARNEAVLRRVVERPNLAIYDALAELRDQLVPRVVTEIGAGQGGAKTPGRRSMDRRELGWSVDVLYRLLMAAVRTGDRTLLIQYANDLARQQFERGWHAEELRGLLAKLETIVMGALHVRPELKAFADDIHHAVVLPLQMVADEVEESFDTLAQPDRSVRPEAPPTSALPLAPLELEKIIAQLEAFDGRSIQHVGEPQQHANQRRRED